MKDNKELRKLSVDKLQAELITLRRDQFALRMKRSNGTLDKIHMVKQLRRAIARVKTIITEKAGNSDVK